MSALTNPTPAPAPPGKTGPAAVPPQESDGKRWGVIVGVLLIIGAAVGYQVWGRKQAQPTTPVAAVRTAKAFVGPLDVTLRVTGQTSARNFANVTTPLLRGPESRGSMTLLKLPPAGTQVHKGELIVQIDAQTAQDHIDDLGDTVSAAENDITKRKAEQKVEWETMQQTLRVTKGQFEKARFDSQPSSIRTPIERELLKLSVDEADARYKQQSGDIEQRKKSQEAELRILQITLERHHRHVNRHVHDLKAFTIHSPMNGLAVMNSVWRGGEMAQFQQGDQVFPGQPIMKVVDTSSMQVEGSVSQADAGNMRIGQKARIGLDAFKDASLVGKVYSIGALAVSASRQNAFVRSVPVRVMIDGADARLIPDLSAHCDVVIETVPDQLQIPLAAVTEAGGKATVMVRGADGNWTQKTVTLGKRNNTHVAIASGLTAGQEVKLN